jgi:hypothetical protein
MFCCASVGAASVDVARHATRICDFLDIGSCLRYEDQSDVGLNRTAIALSRYRCVPRRQAERKYPFGPGPSDRITARLWSEGA